MSGPQVIGFAGDGRTPRKTCRHFAVISPFFHNQAEVTMFSLAKPNAFSHLMLSFALLGMSAGPALAQSASPRGRPESSCWEKYGPSSAASIA